ncbi:MAG: glycosyl hydrolase-related protein [Verrucomicrobiales bacterium]|jgi:alpha-mannosidase|nr:glycosyl hydrolase-related protein [Verrucomicrobiales bacterium]
MKHLSLIIFYNHMDLVWKRPFHDYAEIECDIINKALDLMERFPEFTFYLEQAATLDTYLSWYPDKKPLLEKHLADGRLEIIGGAWALVDLNLPLGESLVRNFQTGLRYLRETLGARPTIGCQADAFGQCAQMPQLLTQFGLRRLVQGRNLGIGNRAADDAPFVWVGADGSRVVNGVRDAGAVFGFYEPGHTAQVVAEVRENLARVAATTPLSVCRLTSEEVLPQRNVVEALLQLAREEDPLTLRFGTLAEYFDRLEQLTVSGDIRPKEFHGEFNPLFTGCYTMRSAIKRANTRLQNKALAVEALWSCAPRGAGVAARMEAGWRLLLANQFHDSMGGCVSDSAFDDIMRRFDTAEREFDSALAVVTAGFDGAEGAHVFNPLPFPRSAIITLPATARTVLADGQPVPAVVADGQVFARVPLPALGSVELTESGAGPEILRPANGTCIENEFYRVDADDGAVRRIVSARDERLALEGMIGELLVREDRGGFWTTRPTGASVSAGRGARGVVEESTLLQRVTVSGELRGVPWDENLRCAWEQETRLWRGEDRVDFIYRVDWAGTGSDLSVAIPLPFPLREAFYETPFAVWRRPAYAPVTEPFADNRGGEWPSLRFVSADCGAWGVSVVHEALHGVSHNDGRFLLNLLHSPDPRNYECGTIWLDQAVPVSGILHDARSHEQGRHEFRFSLRLHDGDWQTGGALRLAEELHQPPLTLAKRPPRLPLTVSAPDNVGWSALKPAADGDGWILRVWEGAGRASSCVVEFGADGEVWRCVMDNERKTARLAGRDGHYAVALAPYEIVTVRVGAKP